MLSTHSPMSIPTSGPEHNYYLLGPFPIRTGFPSLNHKSNPILAPISNTPVIHCISFCTTRDNYFNLYSVLTFPGHASSCNDCTVASPPPSVDLFQQFLPFGGSVPAIPAFQDLLDSTPQRFPTPTLGSGQALWNKAGTSPR